MGPRVLVAEDDETLRFLVSDALTLLHMEVVECPSADNALHKLETFESVEPIDLVLTDIRMPGRLDGVELAQIIWTRWPHIPVILMSGHIRISTVQMPKNSSFLPKPWTLDQLYSIVRNVLPTSAQT